MTIKPTIAIAAVMALTATQAAQAQSSGSSGSAQFQAGYGAARYTTARPATGSTRDPNGNRLIVNGLIQAGASAYSSASGGASASYSGAGGTGISGASAIGNSLNVVVQGNWNTVIVNSTQTNTGDITAGSELNGNLNLGDGDD